MQNPAVEELNVTPGSPMPLGATVRRNGINFAIFSKHATAVSLLLFDRDNEMPRHEIPFDPGDHRTGNIWHMYVNDIDPGVRYGFRMDGPSRLSSPLHSFDSRQILLDPYARAITGAPFWGKPGRDQGTPALRRSIVIEDDFDWQHDRPLKIPLSDSIIYEVHVRGFTCHASAVTARPGTFSGLAEKIPYLRSLGITAIELLPINEFEELEGNRYNPRTGERLLNYWGYNSIGFFAPKASYAAKSINGGAVREFKEMVRAMHSAGIEVILDIVFNHTAEGNEHGQTYSFKGIDNKVYYIVDGRSGEYHNYSGCGNTLNCNHPVVRDMILDCLRYWVTEMHVDGFRFDLASILGRGQDGSVLANPPLLERIAEDPILASTKLIAEAWDAAGLYQVGSFPAWGRWAEWNGKFRDDIRRFVKGDTGMVPVLATRLTGSEDLYRGSGRSPNHSINFITSHDGFTLNDLVSYNQKHNEANGELGRDGDNTNYSWNCGVEGPTGDPSILHLRNRQTRNFAALLLLSHGVPMILSGDECGRTQRGNNNAYCQDNVLSWIDWTLVEKNAGLLRFFRLLIAFRKAHPSLRPSTFEKGSERGRPEIAWHGITLHQPDWSDTSHSLAMQLHSNPADNDLYLIANAFHDPLKFELPPAGDHGKWHRVIDTSLPAPEDIADFNEEQVLENQQVYPAAAHSVVLLMA